MAPFLKAVTAAGIVFMSLALVGLATGLGARYPRFTADNPSQVAGSPGGVAFMIAAVSYIILMVGLLGWPSSLYLWRIVAHPRASVPVTRNRADLGVLRLSGRPQRVGVSYGMRTGVKALEEMG